MELKQWLQYNQLVEHDLIQGSPEWDAFRFEHDGASEAPIMLGESSLASRTELLDAKATGVTREFSDFVKERIFPNGHKVEAMARPIIQKNLGIKLYPVVCSRGNLSASCDGITMDGKTGWEHKQWNEKLAESVLAGELPDSHMAQPQQCMLVTGAEKWIFTVSDGTEENMVSMEILPDPAWFKRILNGWNQFNKDRETHEPRVIVEKPKADVTIELPALFIRAQGEIIDSNMIAYGEALTKKLAEVRAIKLITDQDFSNAKEAAKLFREQCKKLELTKEAMLSQTVTIGEAARMMDAWHEDLRVTALQLEKDVEKEDLSKKRAMVGAGQAAYQAHCMQLDDVLKGSGLRFVAENVDFSAAIKNKRNYASMQDAIDSALANGKIAADAKAKDLRDKIKWFKENGGSQHQFLFADLQAVTSKPVDDFKLAVTSRIEAHKKAEAEKLEAETARIRTEEETKARAKVEAEQRAAAEAEAVEVRRKAAQLAEQEKAHAKQHTPPSKVTSIKSARPSDEVIITSIASGFNVTYGQACDWILEIAESMKEAA